jgi:hypothetical protein
MGRDKQRAGCWTGRKGRRGRDKQRAGWLDRKNWQEGKRQTEGRLDGQFGHWTRRIGRRGRWKGLAEKVRRGTGKAEPVFVNLLGSPGIDSPTDGPVRQPYLSYRLAMLHRQVESNPRNRFMVSLNVYKYGLWTGSTDATIG